MQRQKLITDNHVISICILFYFYLL